MFAALLVLLAMRVPVWMALLIPSIVYIVLDDTATAGLAAQQTASGVFDFAILAVPMFILLGNIANVSGATDRLFDAATSAIGHVRGDRKSTRLNSSHVAISYAVFCLNKRTRVSC